MKLDAGKIGIACSIEGLVLSLVQTFDSIKNADKRAAITGEAAGRAAVDETAKRYHKTIFGDVEIVEDPRKQIPKKP